MQTATLSEIMAFIHGGHDVFFVTTGFTQLTLPTTGTVLTDASGLATITGDEAGNAIFNIHADEGDDTADQWALTALAASAIASVHTSPS